MPDLSAAPEIKKIAKHLKAAGLALEDLRRRTGRDLEIFIASGSPTLVDVALREMPATDNGALIARGGCVVASLPRVGRWDGGDF